MGLSASWPAKRLFVAASLLLVALTSCRSCKEKASSKRTGLLDSLITGHQLAKPPAPTANAAVVVQPGPLAISTGDDATVKADPPSSVRVSLVTASGSKPATQVVGVGTLAVTTSLADGPGQVGFSLRPGRYVVAVLGKSGKVLRSDIVHVPAQATASTLVVVPSQATTIARNLLMKVAAKNPANFSKGYVDHKLIKSMAEALDRQATKSGKPVDSKLLDTVAQAIADDTDKVAKGLAAKGGTGLFGLLDGTDPAASFFAAVDAGIQTTAVQATCAASTKCSVNTASTATLTAGGGLTADLAKSESPIGVLAQLPADKANLLAPPLLEPALVNFIGPLGLSGTTKMAASDKALLTAVTMVGVKSPFTFYSQLAQVTGAANPAKLPPVSDNLMNAYVLLAQGKLSAAMASARAALAKIPKAKRGDVDKALPGYLATYKEIEAAAAKADGFAQAVAATAAAAAKAAQDAAAGTGDFVYGGTCSGFLALSADQRASFVGGAAELGWLCYLETSGQQCETLSPNLRTTAEGLWMDDSEASYCDYVAFQVGQGKCSAFAALDAATQASLADGEALSPVCVKDDPETACDAWHLQDSGAVENACDYTPPAYTAQFTALGQSCSAFLSDWSALYDQDGGLDGLYDLVGSLATDRQVLCTAFPSDYDFPASCEQLGDSFWGSVVTDSANNCVYSVPQEVSAPELTLGGPCSSFMASDAADYRSSYVSELALSETTFCTGFTATSDVPDCSYLSDRSDKASTLQLKNDSHDSTVDCVLDTGGFVQATGSCGAFKALPSVLQNMYVWSSNPGDEVCANVSGAGVSCEDLYDGLSLDAAHTGCRVTPPEFWLGDSCGAFKTDVDKENYGLYVSQLSPPYNRTLCTDAPGAGLTCTDIDPTLAQDASGNCGLPASAGFNIGDTCNAFLNVEVDTWSSYVDGLSPTSATLCTAFRANDAAGVSSCSDLDGRLSLDSHGNCGIAFATYTLGSSCDDFSNLPEVQREYIINTQLTGAGTILCKNVDNSWYGTCDWITDSPETGHYDKTLVPTPSVDDQGNATSDCGLPAPPT